MKQNKPVTSATIMRIGSRSSALALCQADLAVKALQQRNPALCCEIVVFSTKGDRTTDRPLSDFGGQGVFVAELETALLHNEIDIAVHSAKDMPVCLASHTEIAATLARDDARDTLVTVKDRQIDYMRIGTGSARRQMLLKKECPQSVCLPVRGNVPTRVAKLRAGEYSGLILAMAGLHRLGLANEPDLLYQAFDPCRFTPAGGQGIIALQMKPSNRFYEVVESVNDRETMQCLATERYLLRKLGAGCNAPIGVYANCRPDGIDLHLSMPHNGSVVIYRESGAAGQGIWAADRILEKAGENRK